MLASFSIKMLSGTNLLLEGLGGGSPSRGECRIIGERVGGEQVRLGHAWESARPVRG